MVLQKFQLKKADPDYDLQLMWTMTIKPLDFKMNVRRRPGRSLMSGIPGGGAYQQQSGKTSKSQDN